MNWHLNIESAYNWQFVVIELVALCIWASLLKREDRGSAAWWHTVGLILHAGGILVRVGYWAVASTQGPDGGDCAVFPQWACDYRNHLFWAVQASTIGVAMMLRPILRGYFGRIYWAVPITAVAFCSFVIGGYLG